jgi:aryl-alcohol dehydrogenase-like predicted oxidoreductase
MVVSDSGTFRLGGDLPVHRLGFGAMRITGEGIWGPPADHDEAIRVLRRAVELGVTLIDTADSYGPYVSEDLIREALHDGSGYGDVVIATKGGFTRSGPRQWSTLGDPQYLRQCVLMSMRRLGLDRIDLWQLHRIDPKIPREDQFGVMKEFVDEGLVRHVGLSEVDVEEIQAAQRAGLAIASVQNLYNLANRQSGRRSREVRRGAGCSHPAASGCLNGPAGTCLVAASLAGHAAYPGHELGRTSGAEPRGCRSGAYRRRVRKTHRRRLIARLSPAGGQGDKPLRQ